MERASDCTLGKLFGSGLDRPLTLLECGLLSESEPPRAARARLGTSSLERRAPEETGEGERKHGSRGNAGHSSKPGSLGSNIPQLAKAGKRALLVLPN